MKSKRLDVRDAAEILEVSESLFRVYCRAGKFETAVKLRGTTWVVDRKEIEGIASGKIEVDFSGAWGEVYGHGREED